MKETYYRVTFKYTNGDLYEIDCVGFTQHANYVIFYVGDKTFIVPFSNLLEINYIKSDHALKV